MENEFTNLEQSPQVEISPDKKAEVKRESSVEKTAEQVVKKPTSTPQSQVPESQIDTAPIKPVVDAQVKQIEGILADGLEGYYSKLNSADQQKFKQSGEEAAREVNSLLQKAVVKINEIIRVIKKWLASVPGLNKFFIEQSAKIKTDKILIISGKDQ